MARLAVLLFGTISYILFLFTFLYQIGFLTGLLVPKSINDGIVISKFDSIWINILLLSLFAIQHTIMARLSFKRWWTKIVPESIERSIFVLVTSLLLLLMNWKWQPMPEVVWQVDNTTLRYLVYSVSFVGWGIVLYSTFLTNHFDLFGLRQVWLHFRNQSYTEMPFKESLFYRWVRHPLMLGFIIAFWATPDMTQGHLLFTVVTTAYIFFGIQFEERTLLAIHGDEYQQYRKRVSMIIPRPPGTKQAEELG